MRSRSLCVTMTVAALAALTIAGCSAAPLPGPAPTSHQESPSTSLPTTEPPAATPPVPTTTWPVAVALPAPPPDMSRDDEVGAVAAAEYFLELYTYTESSQDIGPWSAMSHADCIFCQSVTDNVAVQRASAQVVKSAPMTVTEESISTLSPVAFSVSLTVTKEPEELWTSDGDFISRASDVGGKFLMVVLRNPSEWIVREVTPMDPVTL